MKVGSQRGSEDSDAIFRDRKRRWSLFGRVNGVERCTGRVRNRDACIAIWARELGAKEGLITRDGGAAEDAEEATGGHMDDEVPYTLTDI